MSRKKISYENIDPKGLDALVHEFDNCQNYDESQKKVATKYPEFRELEYLQIRYLVYKHREKMAMEQIKKIVGKKALERVINYTEKLLSSRS